MGPISHIGPKTSRAARDRPEPNPRRNQQSRHHRSFAGAAAAGGGATRNFARQPRDVAPSATHGRAQEAALSAHRPASSGAPHAPSSPTSVSPEQPSTHVQRPISSRAAAEARDRRAPQRPISSRAAAEARDRRAAQQPIAKRDAAQHCTTGGDS
ncbi:hypothetical protein F511_23551 [Dorcoceras hygrometricum]|uniref:Uncharacterized protein n=1 Tax=Dorcoceras hygrometricum TaxID=472368 RepID=A0A2Z7BXT8_9LAMI|nr:hypothetical protein F511_23551 [Dorcoceras hygrometricum]